MRLALMKGLSLMVGAGAILEDAVGDIPDG